MERFTDQAESILIALTGATIIILVLALITYLSDRLLSKDLSDQEGWRNYRGPVIGFSLLLIGILVVILILLLLLNTD